MIVLKNDASSLPLMKKRSINHTKKMENGKWIINKKMEHSYISGNINSKKLFIFHKVTFQSQKIKKKHFDKASYISENEILNSQAKTISYISRVSKTKFIRFL